MRAKANKEHRSAAVVAVCLLMLLAALVTQAQSGRRAPRKADPVPEATPEPAPAEKPKPKDKEKIDIVLGINGNLSFTYLPNYFFDSILTGCADKLREAPSVNLHVSGRDMTRAQAVKLAKSQKSGYVAYLELRADPIGATSRSYDDLFLEFSLLAPETAKIVVSGRTYQRQSALGSVIPPAGRGSAVYAEQMLKQAGVEAGKRMLNALHL